MHNIIANFLIGIVLSGILIRQLASRDRVLLKQSGFRSFKHNLLTIPIGFFLGIIIYFLQNPPTTHPMVICNAFFQVLSVTIAEVMICWVVIGSSFESALKKQGNIISIIVAIVASSLFFGFYHYAHSPPFNNIHMVLFLSIIGLFTGLFFFISRNLYATIVFHNFFGIKGVIQALDQANQLSFYKDISTPLLVTALIAISILILTHLKIIVSKRKQN